MRLNDGREVETTLVYPSAGGRDPFITVRVGGVKVCSIHLNQRGGDEDGVDGAGAVFLHTDLSYIGAHFAVTEIVDDGDGFLYLPLKRGEKPLEEAV